MATKQELIRKKMIELLKGKTEGIRFKNLYRMLKEHFDYRPGTIAGGIRSAYEDSEVIIKPAYGLYMYKDYYEEPEIQMDEEIVPETEEEKEEAKKEEDFYEPFALWLIDAEVCTLAEQVKSRIAGKWMSPDVMGVWRSGKRDALQFPTEVVSAEIKRESNIGNLMTGFTQACCYKLFSHKSYLVIPEAIRDDHAERLRALCILFGIGLVVFDRDNHEEPAFELVVTAERAEPDKYFANEVAADVIKELTS